ncbi:hypothetical protein Tco_1097063 [Tanacetum coccineum]
MLAECYMQVSEDPSVGSDLNNDTFTSKFVTTSMSKLRIMVIRSVDGKVDSDESRSPEDNEGRNVAKNKACDFLRQTYMEKSRFDTNKNSRFFGDDASPHPPDKERKYKSQREEASNEMHDYGES